MIKAYLPERRKNHRIHGQYVATFRFFYPQEHRLGTREHEAMTLDISESGVSLVSDKKIRVGAHLLIKFMINKALDLHSTRFHKCILFTGVVVYALPEQDAIYRMGIYFGPPSKKNETKFFDIVCSPSANHWEVRSPRFLRSTLHMNR